MADIKPLHDGRGISTDRQGRDRSHPQHKPQKPPDHDPSGHPRKLHQLARTRTGYAGPQNASWSSARPTEALRPTGLFAEMNTYLSDSSWWNAAKRAEAERKFLGPLLSAPSMTKIQAVATTRKHCVKALIPTGLAMSDRTTPRGECSWNASRPGKPSGWRST